MTVELLIKEIKITDLAGLRKVEKILYACGKDMVQKYDIHQWDNTHTKNMMILALCELKNDVFLVSDDVGNPVATFQVRKTDGTLYFEKFGTLPECQGKGIAKKMLEQIKMIAKDKGCPKVACSVYEKNESALEYYLKKGFTVCGIAQTKKYQLINMELSVI